MAAVTAAIALVSRPKYQRSTSSSRTTPSKIKALKLFADVFKHRASLGYDTYDGLVEFDTETVLEYSQRVLNTELSRYVSAPLVSGTWVHEDHDTSVALLHWTVRNMLVKSVFNLTSGVVGLPNKLATLVDTRLEHTVTNVTDEGSSVSVTYSTAGAGEQTQTFDACVIATTAEPARALYPQMDENQRGLYVTTRYHRLGTSRGCSVTVSENDNDRSQNVIPLLWSFMWSNRTACLRSLRITGTAARAPRCDAYRAWPLLPEPRRSARPRGLASRDGAG